MQRNVLPVYYCTDTIGNSIESIALKLIFMMKKKKSAYAASDGIRGTGKEEK